MIYVDTSVLLAHVLAEDVAPPASLWHESLATSRLTTYEAWTRLHARGLGRSHGDNLRHVLARLLIVEMSPLVLERALEPWPAPLRTLDALHLSTMDFLRRQGQEVSVATYDNRLLEAARRMAFDPWADLSA